MAFFLALLEKRALSPNTVLYLTVLNSFMVEALLYGIHAVSFVIVIYLLATKPAPSKVIISALSVMFSLATADIALSFAFVHRNGFLQSWQEAQQVDGKTYLNHLSIIKSYIFVSANLVADMLLVYRCYMVWYQSIYVIILSAPLIIAQTVLGYIASLDVNIATVYTQRVLFLGLILVVNFLMTGVTASHILWLASRVGESVDRSEVKHYRIIVAVIIESGSLYTVSVLLTFVCGRNMLFYFIIERIVGIMPTLLFIQVELFHRGSKRMSMTVQGPLRSISSNMDAVTLGTYQPIAEEFVWPITAEDKHANSRFARMLPLSIP